MILVIGGAYQGKGKFAESLREQEKKAGRERTIVPHFSSSTAMSCAVP